MKYNCPVCQTELTEGYGNSMHPGDAKYGSILFCGAPASICSAQEVCGHGDNFKDAYKVIQEKFVTRKERTE